MIKDLFRFSWTGSPPLAPEGPDPLAAQAQRDVTQMLDEGLLDSDYIIDTLMTHNGDLMQQFEPMVKCRMLGVLSQEIEAIEKDAALAKDGPAQKHRQSMIRAGYHLAISTPIPEAIVERMRIHEDAFIAEFEAWVKEASAGRSYRASDPMPLQHLQVIARELNDMFAKHFGTTCGVETRVYDDPANKEFGAAGWDEDKQKVIIECNAAKIKTLKDLPFVMVTLGHEGVHGIKNYLWNKHGDAEQFRNTHPDLYMFMRLTDQRFYSSENQKVYRKHPEETLAERIGLRLGARTAHALGFKLEVKEFARSAKLFPTKEVISELAKLFPHKRDRKQLAATLPGMKF